jgi:hypothetical protein
MSGLRASIPCFLGIDEWVPAARLAADCRAFRPDVEEEQIADERISCYNCRYRRWAATGICCLAGRV